MSLKTTLPGFARALVGLAALSLAIMPAAAEFSGPPLSPRNAWSGTVPPPSDLIPSRHLSNLIGKTSATICIIGDSTATVGPVAGNAVDPTQMPWGFLQAKLRGDNPQITSWTWDNFAIGGANENHPLQTGTGTGLTLPSWFTNPNATWMSYVQAANCDVLFWMFGTNAATAGENGGSGAATFIRQNFENINGWSYVPNVVIITTKNANPATDTSGDDAVSSAHKAQAAFHRYFARSNAAGYTSFPNVVAKGFGLIDLGRYFTASIEGLDPDAQYLQSVPSALASGFAVTNNNIVGASASTVGLSTGGDFRFTFVLPAEGGNVIGGTSCTALKITASPYIGDYVRLNISGSGQFVPWRIMDGATGVSPSQQGTSVSTSNGSDVTITAAVSGKRTQVTINGTLALDVDAASYRTGLAGGTPINLVCAAAPGATITANITEFFEGIPEPTPQTLSYSTAFGYSASCSSASNGCSGGNNQNHYNGASAELDKRYIQAINMAVPSIGINGTASLDSLLRGYLAGLGTSNDGTSPNTVIDVAAGSAADDTYSTFLTLGAFTKNMNAVWASGSGNGCQDVDSSLSASTAYFLYIIGGPGVSADVLCSHQAFGTVTLPSGYTVKRAIGWVKTDGSSHILVFAQDNDTWYYGSTSLMGQDINVTNQATSAALKTLSVPTGLKVQPLFVCVATGAFWWVTSPDQPDFATAGTFTTLPGYNQSTSSATMTHAGDVYTDTTGEIRIRPNSSTNTLQCNTYGFRWDRGKSS